MTTFHAPLAESQAAMTEADRLANQLDALRATLALASAQMANIIHRVRTEQGAYPLDFGCRLAHQALERVQRHINSLPPLDQ